MERTEYNREYAKRRRATPEGLEQNRNSSRSWRRKRGPHTLLESARHRARTRGHEFTVTAEDIHWPTHCPALGMELIYGGHRGFHPHSASLDRRDNDRGYVPGNVFVLSWRANRIKNDASSAELRAIADYLDKASG